MNIKNLAFSLLIFMPGALNAMEGALATTTQAPQKALPFIKISMTLTDPNPSHASNNGQWRTERICKATPNETDEYNIKQLGFLNNQLDYVALLTSIRLESTTPHPIITYRLENSSVPIEKIKCPTREASDFELPVPYGNPCTLDVELENKTLKLEILIEPSK